MKKFVYIALVALMATSCFGDDVYKNRSSYPLEVTFESSQSFRADSLFYNTTNGIGISWTSAVGGWADLGFYHKLTEDKAFFQGGFLLSQLKGSGAGTEYYDQFRVNSGRGFNGSSTYAVFYDNPDKNLMPEKHVSFLQSAYGTCKIAGFYVNNTAEVVKAVKEKFVPGDKLVLKATGYSADKKTGEVEIPLAEYTTQKDSIIVTWTPFDLDKLGNVDHVEFDVQSTKEGIPAYFCMDTMVAFIEVVY